LTKSTAFLQYRADVYKAHTEGEGEMDLCAATLVGSSVDTTMEIIMNHIKDHTDTALRNALEAMSPKDVLRLSVAIHRYNSGGGINNDFLASTLFEECESMVDAFALFLFHGATAFLSALGNPYLDMIAREKDYAPLVYELITRLGPALFPTVAVPLMPESPTGRAGSPPVASNGVAPVPAPPTASDATSAAPVSADGTATHEG
jgi:hypothetical protein